MKTGTRFFAAVCLSLSSLALLSSSSHGAEPGFLHGNEFQSARLEGDVMVTCFRAIGGAPIVTSFHCSHETLDPVEFDRFAAQADADEVVLSALHEDGSVREKTLSFDSSSGRSEPVNLWIWTLFQRPLLQLGQNQVHYTLNKGGQLQAEGTLSVPVKRAHPRTCAPGSIVYYNDFECQNSIDACNRYFAEQNYCVGN